MHVTIWIQSVLGCIHHTLYRVCCSGLRLRGKEFGGVHKDRQFILLNLLNLAFYLAQVVKNMPAMWETWVWSLGWKDPLKKGKTTHSSTVTQRIPWTEKLDSLQFIGLQRVGHGWVTKHTAFYYLVNYIFEFFKLEHLFKDIIIFNILKYFKKKGKINIK